MNSNSNSDVSILIKTFNRKEALVVLLRSIRSMQLQHLPILIADDSKHPYRQEILRAFPDLLIHYYVMEFDSGISAGRNLLLQKVTTPYIILCDDDFVFDRRTRVDAALQLIRQEPFDIIGGAVFNYESWPGLFRALAHPKKLIRFLFSLPRVSRYTGKFIVKQNECRLELSDRHSGPSITPTDIVSNFFIADSQSLKRAGGWDEELKVGEHEEFFFRMKTQGLSTAYYNKWGVRHYPAGDSQYSVYRSRTRDFKKVLPKKFDFRKYTELNVDHPKILFTWEACDKENLGIHVYTANSKLIQ